MHVVVWMPHYLLSYLRFLNVDLSQVSVVTPFVSCCAEAAASQLQRAAPDGIPPVSGKIALPAPGLSLRSKPRKTPPLETISEQARASEPSAAAGVPAEGASAARDDVAAGTRRKSWSDVKMHPPAILSGSFIFFSFQNRTCIGKSEDLCHFTLRATGKRLECAIAFPRIGIWVQSFAYSSGVLLH